MQSKDDDFFDLEDDSKDALPIDISEEKVDSTKPAINEAITSSASGNQSLKQKLKRFFKDLWQNLKKRWGLIIGTIIILLVIVMAPPSRYFVLNTVGVRSSASLKVLDESTSLPLKNVSVKLAETEVKTDNEGLVKFEKLKLGKTKLVIHKRAFAELSQDITLGWGSNPLSDQKIKPIGVQYSFDVADFLSDKPIEKAEAVSGEYSAFSDEKGHIILTIEQPGEESIEVSIKSVGYRDEPINQLTENKNTQKIAMVPARKHLFVSKRSGKYDVYKIDVDGKNEQLVLSGTGMERSDITLVPRPDKEMAVLVSSRDNARSKGGYLLSTLSLLDLTGEDLQTESITRSENIRIIGWSGDQLVYVKIIEGSSASTPERHRLVTFKTSTGESKELAKADYFNDIVMVGDTIYYAPSVALQNSQTALYSVNANGDNQKTIFNSEIWNIIRTDYDTLMFSVQNDWYEYDINTSKVLASSGAPANQSSRLYADNLDKKHSLWIDERDGKGVLIVYDIEAKSDTVLKSQSGMTYPITWLTNNTIIYRSFVGQEVADYVVNTEGGEPKKIKDVTNTNGADGWNFYY